MEQWFVEWYILLQWKLHINQLNYCVTNFFFFFRMKIIFTLPRTCFKDVILRNLLKHYSYTSSVLCTPRFYSNKTTASKKKYTPRRSVLYVPGNDERKISKVASLDVDCVVLDCEDGVAANRKVRMTSCFFICFKVIFIFFFPLELPLDVLHPNMMKRRYM